MKFRNPGLALCTLALIWAAAAQTPKPAPPQPLPFSHKAHAGTLKQPCKSCHPNPNPGESMRVAPVAACMQCHSAIKADSPHIQRLAALAKENREVRWARVYQIPSYVRFSHRSHLETGNTCQECHGQVAEREALFREGDISMGGCMKCHSTKNASNDCTYCHEPQ